MFDLLGNDDTNNIAINSKIYKTGGFKECSVFHILIFDL